MDFTRLDIPDVQLIAAKRFADDRGFFTETYNQRAFMSAGIAETFVQDNFSRSRHAGTVRGLHYQAPPHAQAKLVRVASGRILDIAVDARKGSRTFARHVSVELSAENGLQLYVPAGFLHGFVTLEPDTDVVYKVTDFYARECDGSVRWDDPELGIDWAVSAASVILSGKDAEAPLWREFETPFVYEG